MVIPANKIRIFTHSQNDFNISFILTGNIGSNVHGTTGNTKIEMEWRKIDERGCIGCFWYDPYKWRNKLNKLLDNKK